jgi:hypothetical protein
MNWNKFTKYSDIENLDKSKWYILAHAKDCYRDEYYEIIRFISKDQLEGWCNMHGMLDVEDFVFFHYYCEIDQPERLSEKTPKGDAIV